MASFEGILANIPGYGGYLAKRKYDEQSQLGELEQVGGAIRLIDLLRKQKQAQEYQSAVGALPSDATEEQTLKAITPYVGAGDVYKGITASKDRQATLKQTGMQYLMTYEQKQEALDTKHEEFIKSNADANTKALADQQYKADTLKNKVAQDQVNNFLRQQGIDISGELADLKKKDLEFKQSQLGAGTGLSGESAGKIAMADQAVVDIRDVRTLLFDKKGELKRGLVAAMNTPLTAGMPGNAEARSAYSKMQNAVAAKLRIETGAAATESEVKGILDRFLPKLGDPTSVAKERLDRLEEFMNTTIDQTKGVRIEQLRSRQGKAKPTYPTATGPNGEKIQFKDGKWQPIQQ